MRSFQMCRVKGRFRKRLREGKRNSSNLRRNKQRLENPIQHMAMGEDTGHGNIPKKGELKTRSLSKLPATTDPTNSILSHSCHASNAHSLESISTTSGMWYMSTGLAKEFSPTPLKKKDQTFFVYIDWTVIYIQFYSRNF